METAIETINKETGKVLHPTESPRQRAFLVGAEIAHAHSPWQAEDSLQELALLAITAGLDVVGSIYQKLTTPFSKFFIGPGKVQQIAKLREEEETAYDLVIFDDELTAAQTRNLERELNVTVLDRTALILDIFAQHARTHEGRIQVELAQYEYLLPRLRRQWTHLERQAGQGGTSAGGVVGLRGPGETQLEVDRRVINRRIIWLKEQLADVHHHREMYRKRRRKSGVPIVALVGYTNAGKSTLINALTDAHVLVQDQLFATLDPTTRKVCLPGGQHVLITDTVGFIQKLPTQLVAAFRATLEEISEADILVHVLDITHPNAQEQERTVMATLKDLGVADKPILTVLNKVDRMPGASTTELDDMAAELGLPQTYLAISAQNGWGLDTLLNRIETILSWDMVTLDVVIPYHRNDLVTLWRQCGVVEHQEFEGQGTRIKGRIPVAYASEFASLRR